MAASPLQQGVECVGGGGQGEPGQPGPGVMHLRSSYRQVPSSWRAEREPGPKEVGPGRAAGR